MSIYYKLACAIECNKERSLLVAALFVLLLIAVSVLNYFYQTDWRHTVLIDIRERGELVVVTRNAPTTYYEGQNGEYAGLEYDLAQAFAEYLGVHVRFVVKDSVAEILSTIEQGKADIAAAGLARSGLDSNRFRLGPVYQTVHEVVVCRRDHHDIPATIEELSGRSLVIPQNERYQARLQQLKRSFSLLNWQQIEDADTEQLLWRVWKREYDCTVSDSNILAINQRYYPELVEAIDLNDYTSLNWVMPKHAAHLQSHLDLWLDNYIEAGGLHDLMERYYGHLQSFDYVDTRRFRNSIYRILPKYRRWFQRAAKKYHLDWHLLAAISYQESHWNPKARSPTGVRGMMMLTQPTARQLGVESRLDARANIYAGAQYIAEISERLPVDIPEPERTLMVMAAYNMGYGHLQDARELCESLGKDPNRWIDLESVLPLLSQRKYYKNLKHGYARGYEAIDYINRVRVYRDILQQNGVLKNTHK